MIGRSRLQNLTFCVKRSLALHSRRITTQAEPGLSRDPRQPLHQSRYNAEKIAMAKQYQATANRKKRKLTKPAREGTNEEVLAIEVRQLLAKPRRVPLSDSSQEIANGVSTASATDGPQQAAFYETELEIEELSSTGDGLARSPVREHIYVIPFAVPGDRVRAKVRRNVADHDWSSADFLEVLRPSPERADVTPGCRYFSTCSGCQLQMLPYEAQLAHKKTIVEKAFRNFSDLPPHQIPPVGPTGGSPLQYGYRTKLTPHFDGPPRLAGEARRFREIPKIGFTRKNWRQVMDIENCPIGTEIVQEGLKVERAKVAANISKYKNGATILLRETTRRISTAGSQHPPDDEVSALKPSSLESLPPPTKTSLTSTPSGPELTLTYPTHTDVKTYTSNENSFSTEHISSYTFTSRAGSFFQNNNSILAPFLSYVRSNALQPPNPSNPQPPIKYMLDAYCGSGLFAVTLAPLFISVLGIDIDGHSIAAARLNAAANAVPNAGFIEADAGALFADVPFPGEQSLVVIDPPRKGASEDFLRQLCHFGPARVVYVSCNVHTQARDVGMLVRGFGKDSGWRYAIESLRGFDFFPQTGHVEGLCFLNRVPHETGDDKGDGEPKGEGESSTLEKQREVSEELEALATTPRKKVASEGQRENTSSTM